MLVQESLTVESKIYFTNKYLIKVSEMLSYIYRLICIVLLVEWWKPYKSEEELFIIVILATMQI